MTNEKTITLLNTEETYRSLQPFQSIEELNANTEEIRAQYADQMTPSTYAVLDVLHRYASKFYGVSYRSKSKIALELGISRRTVIRACNALEKLGVIEQVELKRHNGDRRQSANAIVFIEIEKTDNDAVGTPDCHAKDTPTNAQKDLSNTYDTQAYVKNDKNNAIKESKTAVTKRQKTNTPNPLDKSLLKDSLPEGWFEQASPYAQDYNDLYRITGELFKAKVHSDLVIEDFVEEFGAVLRTAWGKLKNGRINPQKWYAYLFTAFRRKAHNLEKDVKAAPILNDITAMFDPQYDGRFGKVPANSFA